MADPQSNPDAGGIALVLSAVGAVAVTIREVIAWRNKRALVRLEATADQAKLLATTQAEHERAIWQRLREMEQREGSLTSRIESLEDRLEEQQSENLKLERELNLVTMDRDRLIIDVNTRLAVIEDLRVQHAAQIAAMDACQKRVTDLEAAIRLWNEMNSRKDTGAAR